MAFQDVSVRVRVRMAEFRKSMDQASRSFNKFGRKMGRIGAQMSAAISVPAGLIAREAFNEFREFEHQMARVKAISGATQDEFKLLEESARKLGGTTAFTAREVGSLQEEYAKLGFSTAEILKAQDSTLKLAYASGTELSEAAMITGNALRAFGVDASRTADVQDVFAAAITNSALDMEQLRDSFSYVAPVAKSAGLSIQDTSAILGTLSDNGIKGSKAGTALRRILLEMSKAGLSGAEGFKEFAKRGFSVVDSYDAVGRSAVSALNVLANNGTKLDELSEKMFNASGSLAEMEKIMMNTTEGAMKLFQSSLSETKMQIGAMVAEALVPIIRKITEFLDRINEANPALKSMAVKFVGVLAAAGPVLGIISAISFAMAALSGPVIGIVAGLSALIAMLSTSREEWEAFDEVLDKIGFGGLGQAMADAKDQLMAALQTLWDKLVPMLENLVNFLAVIWENGIKPFLPIFNRIWSMIIDNLGAVFEFLGNMFEAFTNIFSGDWDRFWQGLLQLVIAPLKFVQKLFYDAVSGLLGIVGDFAAALGMEGISNTLEAWAQGIDSFGDQAAEAADQLAGFNDEADKAGKFSFGSISLGGGSETNTTDPLTGGATGGGSGDPAEDAKAIAKAYTEASDAINQAFNTTYTNIRQQQLDGSITADEAADMIAKAEEEKLKKMLELNKKYGKDVSEIQKRLADHYIAQKDREMKADQQAFDERMQGILENMQYVARTISAIGDLFDTQMQMELNAVGDNEEKQQAIRKKYAKKRKAMAMAEAIMNGALAATKVFAQTGVFASLAMLPVAAATAANVAAIAATPFANGGIVSGPTLSLTGEYPGAKSNPEVIAPLSKLKGMISDVAGGGGGNTHLTGNFRVEGQDLVLALDRAQANKSRRRR